MQFTAFYQRIPNPLCPSSPSMADFERGLSVDASSLSEAALAINGAPTPDFSIQGIFGITAPTAPVHTIGSSIRPMAAGDLMECGGIYRVLLPEGLWAIVSPRE